MNPNLLDGIQVLAFDVFGTVVDWHGSIVHEVVSLKLPVDPEGFANAWRDGYRPAMARVRSGELPWTRIDDLHRLILDQILDQFNLNYLEEEVRRNLNLVWHRLKPWEDSILGLQRLKKKICNYHIIKWQSWIVNKYGKECRITLGLNFVSGGL